MYIGLLFYRFFKFLGWKSLNNKFLHPYYISLRQIRRQMDIRRILQRFLYLERAITCLLPPHLHALLFYFTREDITHLEEMRQGFKKYDEILEGREKRDSTGVVEPENAQEPEPEYISELRNNFRKAVSSNDELSRKVLKRLDPEVVTMLNEKHAMNGMEQNNPAINSDSELVMQHI